MAWYQCGLQTSSEICVFIYYYPDSQGCAASVWLPSPTPVPIPSSLLSAQSNGTCILKKACAQPINSEHGAAFWQPGVPVPAPVIRQQAGIIVG